ncbi:hypothetical protein P692DRAFT_201842185 [Suillus brevipes Sb2]|nr:hypothetical protein P692DRAFT_201842185 [Suillus brevipes Sb2]
MAELLPPELWSHTFVLAADGDTIFYHGLPTSITQSSWVLTRFLGWQLKTPRDSINIVQRRGYATKKVRHFLVRYLFCSTFSKLHSLTTLLTSNPSLGWWTRRLHITHFLYDRGLSLDDFEVALTSVLIQTPNLETFIVDWPLSRAFGPIADMLGTHCKILRTAHWRMPPLLVSLAVVFDAPLKDSGTLTLGSAQDVKLHLPNLQQLILRGYSAEFIKQASGWSLPLLRSFSFDLDSKSEDIPDVLSFLSTHGTSLLFVDINSIPALDIHGPIVVTNCPHEHITHIGLHGLDFAFGVGTANAHATPDPLPALLVQRTNDRNFAALNKASFPRLERVRVLSLAVLTALERAHRPQAIGMERRERWAGMCEGMSIRLEDCTGALLGTLPQNEEGGVEVHEGSGDNDLHWFLMRPQCPRRIRRERPKKDGHLFGPLRHVI